MNNTEKDIKTLEMVYDALEQGRVKVYYQPQFDAKTCELISAEALCRIVNEYDEIIMPGSFIPVLEKQESPDAIKNFDWFIFTRVCRFLQKLKQRDMRLIPIAVNLSRRHLLSDPAELYISATANRMDIPHKYLGVEITESAAENDPLEIQRLIYKIRMQGFRVAIDDFGTGSANFKFLIDNQADIIKLDRSFIAHGCDDPREQVVVANVIHMAKMLGMTVVSEGVEEARQWNFLRDHGCDIIQGFFAGEPLTEEEFMDFYHGVTRDI